ncbi:MAG: FtsB family cell division protein [Pyrinomonadaceae bacterium]
MSKVVVKRSRARVVNKPLRWRKEPRKRVLPSWMPVAAAITLVLMLVLTINYRAYTDLKKESRVFDELNGKVQQATTENLSMQEEIYYLKSDPKTIEREARKYGLARPKEQVSRAGETDKAEQSASRQLPTRK